MKPQDVLLGLGANVGDRLHFLRQAIQMLKALPVTRFVNESSVYESEPVGYTEQAMFLNMAVQLQTSLIPAHLLKETQAIEAALGRVRKMRWGPRTLDIDVLYWGRRVIASETLQVPHPEAEGRLFVMRPLREIAPEFCPPPSFVSVRELCARIDGGSSVSKYQSNVHLHEDC